VILDRQEVTFDPRSPVGLRSAAIDSGQRKYALEFVRSLAVLRRQHEWSFEIIGMGEIMNAHDVRALMANGADAVQTATAATNNPGLPKDLCNDGHHLPSEEEHLVALLSAALADRRWSFRTLEGLAKDLHLEVDRVQQLLSDHPEIVRESVMTGQSGHKLYAGRGRPPTLRERLERYRWILAR
jgi:tRNA-dihydrouridine synthase